MYLPVSHGAPSTAPPVESGLNSLALKQRQLPPDGAKQWAGWHGLT